MSWFAVYTHSHAEMKANIHLEQQGFKTYFPRYRKYRTHARRVETVIAPLFPRYLFVDFDPFVARWRCVCSTTGVSRLVGDSEKPTPVPDCVVADLRSREDAFGLFPVEQKQRLSVGDTVQISAGSFADRVGRIHCLDGNERVVVLLNLLGRQVKTSLQRDIIAIAS